MHSNHSIKFLALGLLGLLILACSPPFGEKTYYQIIYAQTNNPSSTDEKLVLQSGDCIDVTLEYKIDPDDPYDRWDFEPYLEKSDTCGPLGTSKLRVYEKDGEKKEHEWPTACKEKWDFKGPGSYGLYVRIQGYKKKWDGTYVLKRDDFGAFYCEIDIGYKYLPTTDGIFAYCGDERYAENYRYGYNDEVLDYPICYPLVAQVCKDRAPAKREQVVFTIQQGKSIAYFPSSTELPDKDVVVGITDDDVLIGDPLHNINHDPQLCGCETVDGVFKCPLAIRSSAGTGVVVVQAEWLNPPEGVTNTTTEFKISCVYPEEQDEVAEETPDKGMNYHERVKGEIIKGDGLWGNNIDPQFNSYTTDPQADVKNLQLEIDWLSSLGSADNVIELTFEDIEFICQELGKIFYDSVGIRICPVVNLNDEHEAWEAVSVASQMDAYEYWSTSPAGLIVEANKTTGYNDLNMIDILMITRGNDLLGKTISKDGGEPEVIPHYVRRRLHILLLPGEHKDLDCATTASCDVEASRYISGEDYEDHSFAFPWSDGDEASHKELPMDWYGICVFTGKLPDITEASYKWICPSPRNPYCYMLVKILAHEIGHALGLAHQPDEYTYYEDLMYPFVDFKSDDYHYFNSMKFSEIYSDNEDNGFLINLRKLLGRETVTTQW